MADDDTQRFFESVDLSATSDAISVSFAQVDSAEDFERMAQDFDAAAKHCRTAAQQMIEGRVPMGCAHGLAAQGRARRALHILDEVAIRHADHGLTSEQE